MAKNVVNTTGKLPIRYDCTKIQNIAAQVQGKSFLLSFGMDKRAM